LSVVASSDAFYRPERWASSVTSGGRAIRSQVKRRGDRSIGRLPRPEEHPKESQASHDRVW
jgi:hypothetical protein